MADADPLTRCSVCGQAVVVDGDDMYHDDGSQPYLTHEATIGALVEWKDLDERIKDDLRASELCEDQFESEHLIEMFERDLEELGLNGLETLFSLGYSQGDGVAFKGFVKATEITDPEFQPILAMFGANREHGKVAGVDVSWLVSVVEADIEISNDGRYSHSHSMSFTTTFYDGAEEELDDWDGVRGLYAAIVEYFRELSGRFEKAGYDEIEYHLSDEYLNEQFQDKLFSPADGEVVSVCWSCWKPDWVCSEEGCQPNRTDEEESYAPLTAA